MKHILVPTDFSNNADNALHYALHIANQFECKIHLMHVVQIQSITGLSVQAHEFVIRDAQEKLAKKIEKFKSYLHYGTSIVANVLQGHSINRICIYAENIKADLIIMGTQGATGLKEIFWGSNTVDVIRNTTTPTLVIPTGYKYQAIKNIVFSVDSSILSSSDVLQTLVQIAKKHKSIVNVLHVEKIKTVASIDAAIDIFLTSIPHMFHIIKGSNISDDIQDFVKETGADMLCMIKRERSFIEQIFHSSKTIEKAFHSSIPLLILHDF